MQRAMPFYEGVYCDQWICALAAAFGTVAFVDLPLVRYRRHSDNQTGTLRQIQSRQDYYDKRVLPAYGLVLEMKKEGSIINMKRIYRPLSGREKIWIFPGFGNTGNIIRNMRILIFSCFVCQRAWCGGCSKYCKAKAGRRDEDIVFCTSLLR